MSRGEARDETARRPAPEGASFHLLVTGLGGFVGRRLARRALAAGDRVSGLQAGPLDASWADEVGEGAGSVRFHEADVLDPEAVGRVLAEARPDAIVHLAGLSHVGDSWERPGEYFRVNVLGTETVLAAAPPGVPVVLASSGEVYGAVPEAEQPIAEERLPAPASPYALTKAAAERIVLGPSGGGRGIVVRSFNLAGPGQSPRFALTAFAAQLAAIRRGERPPVLRVGNLSARRDFLHVDDGADAYRLLARRGRPGTVYNLASGRAVSIEWLLDRLIGIAGVDVEIEVDPERFRPVDQPLLAGDAGRLAELGWEPRRSVEEALAELWEAALAEAGGIRREAPAGSGTASEPPAAGRAGAPEDEGDGGGGG